MNRLMTTGRIYALCPRTLTCLCATLVPLFGCVSDQQKYDAIVAVNREFRAQYEVILAEKGTRGYMMRRDEAFSAMSKTLAELGMQPESVDQSLGFMSFYAMAPTPLTEEDWRATVAADLPKMRELARPYIGFPAEFIKFEPEGLQLVVNASILDAPAGVLISITIRMRQIEPPRSGMPRRDYPPPTGMRIGLDRVWTRFELEIGRRQALPRQPTAR